MTEIKLSLNSLDLISVFTTFRLLKNPSNVAFENGMRKHTSTCYVNPTFFFFISKTNLRPKIHRLYLIYGKTSVGIEYDTRISTL